MKKLNFLEKLSKEELKKIKASSGEGVGSSGSTGGTRTSGSGGTNNPGNGTNDNCGFEPECFSQQWYVWYNCKVTTHGTQPYTQC